MKNALIVIVAAVLINLWLNNGISAQATRLDQVSGRLIPLACVSALSALVCWRRETRGSRMAGRVSGIILLGTLLNVAPFMLRDLNDSIGSNQHHFDDVSIQSSSLSDSALAVFQPGQYKLKSGQHSEEERYRSALSECVRRMKAQHYSENSSQFKCVSDSSRMGYWAFMAHYSKAETPAKSSNN